MLNIKVLGSGCGNCHKVEELAKQAIAQLGVEAQVELVSDVKEMLHYGVMATPAIVINEKLVLSGRVPALSQVTTLITNALT
jgi:small redox-active disulfide protein 2